MPKKPGDERGPERRDETPRTDLPPKKEPYYEGYFGTDEEEGVVREREDGGERDRNAAEDAAGGDRELI
jgi:hypothetical protein